MNEQPKRFRDLDPEVQEAIKKKTRALISVCTELLDALEPKLSETTLRSTRLDLRAGEWALMLDLLAVTLIKQRIPVTAAERDLLDRGLTVMGDQPGDTYPYLNDRQRTLDALTMLDDAGQVVPPVRPLAPPPPPARPGSKGGHLHGIGIPHKTTFPPSWDAERIDAEVLDVARNPDVTPQQDRNGGWLTRGVRGGVEIEVRLRPAGPIMTGYPVAGLGVHRTDASGTPHALGPR
jgi:Bacterial EndoU nuclease